VEATNPEYSGGQFEVNISRASPLSAADQGTLLRLYARILARRHALDTTFLPKPWTEESGSGAHFHQSLWRGTTNVFFGGDDMLSAEGRGYLAGLLEAMPDLAMIGSPTPNGFHRRADGSFAPTSVSWATDNRTAGVRVVFGGPKATRIEYRDGAADCNFYLALGSQILSGLDGLRRQLEPPPPITGNGYAMPDLPLVPRTFLEAYDRFRDSELIARLLPGPLRDAYLAALEPEVEQVVVRSADWERERYGDVPL
jgi:glutamine synthetase